MRQLLIANRGEIACRIMRTCRKLGVRTLAVYSDADADQPFVALADHAFVLRGNTPRETYLNQERILAIAREQGADAVHPGYGFLAENAGFARRCQASGLTFVGPRPEAIQQMGAKDQAREIARRAGVPVVPGYEGSDQQGTQLLARAEEIGFPVLLKAVSGGGGKGMRPVFEAQDFDTALREVQREAESAFGDSRVLLEKLIHRPRHIEVQIMADRQGHCVHLFERECSVQRRYQKLIEEAPAAFLSEPQRTALHSDAVRLAQAIGYDSLGTVEFIFDPVAGQHYFLEMNTRLQVEHAVTEAITGLDLVEWQLRIAAGEPLSLRQDQLCAQGWAVEARLNAEDPQRDFLPSTGRVGLYLEPDGDDIRVDSGVVSGVEVSPWYDSLLAKVIATGTDRTQAVVALRRALDGFLIEGPVTNREFLGGLLSQERFLREPLHTGVIDEWFSAGWRAVAPPPAVWGAALAWHLNRLETLPDSLGWRRFGGWRLLSEAGWRGLTQVTVTQGERTEEFYVSGHGGEFRVQWNEGQHALGVRAVDEDGLTLTWDGERHRFRVYEGEGSLGLIGCGGGWVFRVQSGYARREVTTPLKNSDGEVLAPMPGMIVEIAVGVGDRVTEGTPLIILEAMKLVHRLEAPVAGIVGSLRVETGQTVSGGQLLLMIDPEGQPS